jgi:hypothetical protein
MDERDEHALELFKPRENAPKSLEPTEQPFDLVASLLQGAIVFPWRASIVLGRHHRHRPSIPGQLPRGIAFIRPIHQQGDGARPVPEAVQPRSPLGGIVGLARGEGKRSSRSSIRGNQMTLGGPSAASPAHGLRAGFFNAPVPSGWTLTRVRSTAPASIFTRMI